MMTVGMYIEKEYPYVHNTETNEISEPKHFIKIERIKGRRKPIP